MSEFKNLIEGYHRFHDNYFVADKEHLFAELSQGQHPSTLVIACSDSRVDPAIVMDCKPGDLFVVRNVANMVPPYEKGGGIHGVSAALEFAVRVLEVKHIIVMGHSQCGGIRALLEGIPESMQSEFIGPWVNMARRAKERVYAEHPRATSSEQLCQCEMGGIVVSLENLQTFSWIKSKVAEGKLNLHGWYFDIESGEMLTYNLLSSEFERLS